MISLFALILLLYTGLATPAEVELADPSGFVDKDIFILAGQSNMAGRGGVVNDETWDGIVPPECQPSPSILRLNAKLKWVEAREPLHADIDATKICGVGPGMAFANAIRDKDSSIRVVGLVPCAIGGTNISEWGQGTRLYKKLVTRTETSLSHGGRLRAILWYQGESDTLKQEDADSYKERMERLILALRGDLGSPFLPIIQVALASGTGPFLGRVRAAQLGIDLPNVSCVDAKGLPLQSDGLHLTTVAQAQLGAMLADSFLSTQQRSPITSSATRKSPGFL